VNPAERSVQFATDALAWQVSLEIDQNGFVFDGNRFGLPPGGSRTVRVLWPEGTVVEAMEVTRVNGG
jgi:hypothetical protein